MTSACVQIERISTTGNMSEMKRRIIRANSSNGSQPQVVTKVIRAIGLLGLFLFARSAFASQTVPAAGKAGEAFSRSVADLYTQLQQVGLDEHRVYKVRNLTFGQAAFHISLDDGTLAFTQDVFGKVTGAFFQGDGEVLLLPPNQAER